MRDSNSAKRAFSYTAAAAWNSLLLLLQITVKSQALRRSSVTYRTILFQQTDRNSIIYLLGHFILCSVLHFFSSL